MTDTRLSLLMQTDAMRSDWVRHAPVALLGGLCVCALGLKAAKTPLWFDEIVTYHVAALGSPGDITEALLAKADNHPPLDFLARSLSMSVLGTSELAFRLPSIIAMLVAALCLYVFVLRRTSVAPALVAFSFPFATLALRYSYEARGYAFLMASMGLVLLTWQLASEKPSPARLTLFTISLCLGPYSHYYGVLNYVPIAVGEAWRSWEDRRICRPIAGCVLVSLALLGPLAPFVLSASEFAQGFWTKLGPNMLAHAYIELFERAIPALVASLIVAAVFIGLGTAARSDRQAAVAVPRHEIAAAVALCLLPFVTYMLALFVTHAFTFKYVLNTVLGVAILAAYLVHRAAGWRRGCSLFITLSFVAWVGVSVGYVASQTSQRVLANAKSDAQLLEETGLPLVAPAHRFLEDSFYMPAALRSRLYYIAEPELALKYRGHDTNERALRNLKPFAPINVMDLCSFTGRHPKFLLVGKSFGGVAGKLLADGADISLHPASAPGNAVLSVVLERPSGC